jgi:hypothetical protein
MRTVSQFITEDPKQLGTLLSKFEQNVVQETADIRQIFQLSPVASDGSAAVPIASTYTVGQSLRADTRIGAISFNLTPPSNGLPGEFVLIQVNGANGFVAIGVNCTINGATKITTTPSAQVVFRFYCDGKNYWV